MTDSASELLPKNKIKYLSLKPAVSFFVARIDRSLYLTSSVRFWSMSL